MAAKIDYSFDPLSQNDLGELFKFLHIIYPKIPSDPDRLSVQSNADVSEYQRKISEQDELIKYYEEQNSQDCKEKEDLKSKVEHISEHLKKAQEVINKYKCQVNDISQEKYDLEQKLNQDHKAEINRIKDEKEKEIKNLNKQISDLVKKLSEYEPMIGNGEGSETKYFRIEGNDLVETMDDRAPFIGKVEVNGDASFQFNIEKGPHKKYSQDSFVLEKFCEIVEKLENANHINMSKWGTGKYLNGTLKIVTKAQIKLTKE